MTESKSTGMETEKQIPFFLNTEIFLLENNVFIKFLECSLIFSRNQSFGQHVVFPCKDKNMSFHIGHSSKVQYIHSLNAAVNSETFQQAGMKSGAPEPLHITPLRKECSDGFSLQAPMRSTVF